MLSVVRRLSPSAGLAVASLFGYLTLSLSVYRRYQDGYDLGLFDQAVRQYSHFRAPLVALKGPDFNLLGDHFHPILIMLAPLYWVFDDPRTLLVAQAVLLAFSVLLVQRYAARYLTSTQALLLAAGYAFGWPLQAMVKFDFHEVAFGVPLICWALDSLDRRSDRELLIASILLVLVREDLGLLVLLIGLLRIGQRPRWVAGTLIIGGLGAYFVTTQLVLPHFSSTGRFTYWNYDALGPDAQSALASVLLHPGHAIAVFFTPWQKTGTLLLLLAPVALLCLRSRLCLLLLPLLAERFFSSREQLWTVHAHYSALSWPIVTLAAVNALARLSPSRRTAWTAVPMAFAVIGTAVSASVYPLHAVITGNAFRIDARVAARQQAVQLIPAGSCVVTDDHLAVHLDSRSLVSLPGRLGRRSDFVLLDLSRSVTGFNTPSPQQAYRTALADGDRVIFSRDEIVLLRSSTYAGPTRSCRP